MSFPPSFYCSTSPLHPPSLYSFLLPLNSFLCLNSFSEKEVEWGGRGEKRVKRKNSLLTPPSLPIRPLFRKIQLDSREKKLCPFLLFRDVRIFQFNGHLCFHNTEIFHAHNKLMIALSKFKAQSS